MMTDDDVRHALARLEAIGEALAATVQRQAELLDRAGKVLAELREKTLPSGTR